MITIQQETLFDIVDEVDSLLKLHYEELCIHKDRIKLDPMWESYANLEAVGAFAVYTARDDGKLVGYSAFFVSKHMHYAQTVVASNDVLFLHPDYRKGRTGVKLIKFSEEKLKSLGVNKITWHAKLSNDFAQLLYRLGYANEEIVVGKML